MTAEDEKARLESDVRRLKRELEQLRAEHQQLLTSIRNQHETMEVFRDLLRSHEYKLIQHDVLLRRLDPNARPTHQGIAPEDGKGWACLDHRPVQHRDAKVPWCNSCGRTGDGEMIGRPRWLRPDQHPAPVDSSGEHARCSCVTGDCRLHARPKPVIVGVEHHEFTGAGLWCTGTMGYAVGHPRHGEFCGYPKEAEIHALPPGWTSWGNGYRQ